MSQSDDDTPGVPLFGSWRNAYVIVVVTFVVEVALFYWISSSFA